MLTCFPRGGSSVSSTFTSSFTTQGDFSFQQYYHVLALLKELRFGNALTTPSLQTRTKEQPGDSESMKLFKQGVLAHSLQNLKLATHCIKSSLPSLPPDTQPVVRCFFGQIYFDRRKIVKADLAAKTALQALPPIQDSVRAAVLHLQGRVFIKQQAYTNAFLVFRYALQCGPLESDHRADILLSQGKLLMYLNRFGEAQESFQQALLVSQKEDLTAELHVNMALVSYHDFEIHYNAAVACVPPHHKDLQAQIWMVLGLACQEDEEQALEFLQRAVDCAPSNKENLFSMILFLIGLKHIRKGYIGNGQALLERAVLNTPTNEFNLLSRLHLELAKIQNARKESKSTLDQLNRAMETNPTNEDGNKARTEILCTRAEVFVNLNYFEEAVADYSEVIEKDQPYLSTLLTRAKLYIRMGKNDLAYLDLKRASDLIASEESPLKAEILKLIQQLRSTSPLIKGLVTKTTSPTHLPSHP